MADPMDLVGMSAAGGGVAVVGRWIFDRFVSRADRTEEKAEAERDEKDAAREAKLDQVLSVLTRLERDMALMTERQAAQAASTSEVKARIDGVSANHGPRIASLEERVTRLEVQADPVFKRTRKP